MPRGPQRQPPKKWNPNPAGRPADALVDHPEHGQIGSLAAIGRELGASSAAISNWRKRHAGHFPAPILGNTYALQHVQEFRDTHVQRPRAD